VGFSVKNSYVAKARGLLFPPAVRSDGAQDRSEYERFAIPFTFKPQLSFVEAVIEAAGAFLRVFLGSVLFAVWGAYSLVVWTTVRSLFWRVSMLFPLFLAFVLAFALLMLAIAALVRAVLPRRS
jgi:hypothetical protein